VHLHVFSIRPGQANNQNAQRRFLKGSRTVPRPPVPRSWIPSSETLAKVDQWAYMQSVFFAMAIAATHSIVCTDPEFNSWIDTRLAMPGSESTILAGGTCFRVIRCRPIGTPHHPRHLLHPPPLHMVRRGAETIDVFIQLDDEKAQRLLGEIFLGQIEIQSLRGAPGQLAPPSN